MPKKTIRIVLNGKTLTAATGTKISELLTRAPHPGELPALGAIANRRLTGLYRTLTADAVVDTLDYNSKLGAYIYRRSLCLLLLAVLKELYPKTRVEIGQSLGEGYFVEVEGLRVTAKTAERIQKRMVHYVEKDMPFLIDRVFVDEAVDYFLSVGSINKVRYLTQVPRSEVRIVSLLGIRDILHGPVCLGTEVLQNFRVQKFRTGLLLAFPTRTGKTPRKLADTNHKLLFETFTETRQWYDLVGVSNVSELNKACVTGTVSDLIKVSESLHEKKIAKIADQITQRKVLPKLVLIAGPSSSGKTTFSRRLGVNLRVNGIRPFTLSMDNYYVNRADTPRHEDGSYNFEAVDAIDLPLFSDHLARIIKGHLVQTPVFSFSEGKRVKGKTIPIQLDDHDVLVVEGIHGLNPALCNRIPKSKKFGIFVSALTQLCLDEHNRIFTSDTRLVRRMVRDRLYRGRNAKQTLDGWESVRAGEDKYIFPYQDNADVMFNSALVYEHAVLKQYAKRFLLEVCRDDPAFTEAERLYHFLENFIPILPEEVPFTSVLREFIGGSTFEY